MPQAEHTKSDATIWLKELVNNLSSALNNLSRKQEDTANGVATLTKQIWQLELDFSEELNKFKIDFIKEITPLKIKSKIWFQVLASAPGLVAALWLILKG